MTKATYHHGALRDALIAAGTEMARRGGPDAVVLREAARRVGVSHSAGYRHFANREALVAVIAARARTGLASLMRELLAEIGAGDEGFEAAGQRLRATGAAYVRYALTEPGLFRTAFTGIGLATKNDAEGSPTASSELDDDPFELLQRHLREFFEAAPADRDARPHAELVAWSAVHGLSMLLIDGELAVLTDNARDDVIDSLLATIEAGLLIDAGDGRE